MIDTPTPDTIEALAKAAVAADKEYYENPSYETGEEAIRTKRQFKAALSPQAILTLLRRNRELENALTALLPDYLAWKEDGRGRITIEVDKSTLRKARALSKTTDGEQS